MDRGTENKGFLQVQHVDNNLHEEEATFFTHGAQQDLKQLLLNRWGSSSIITDGSIIRIMRDGHAKGIPGKLKFTGMRNCSRNDSLYKYRYSCGIEVDGEKGKHKGTETIPTRSEHPDNPSANIDC